jgi:acyl-CoA thioester hydrolase
LKTALVSVVIETRPQFYDVDPMGIVWHGNYPRFFELARVALLDRIDYGYEAMTQSGFAWPIVDMGLRYAKPIKLLQRIEVHAGIVEWENRLKTLFEIYDADSQKRLTRGHSVQVALDMQTEELLWETPPILREKLAPFLAL